MRPMERSDVIDPELAVIEGQTVARMIDQAEAKGEISSAKAESARKELAKKIDPFRRTQVRGYATRTGRELDEATGRRGGRRIQPNVIQQLKNSLNRSGESINAFEENFDAGTGLPRRPFSPDVEGLGVYNDPRPREYPPEDLSGTLQQDMNANSPKKPGVTLPPYNPGAEGLEVFPREGAARPLELESVLGPVLNAESPASMTGFQEDMNPDGGTRPPYKTEMPPLTEHSSPALAKLKEIFRKEFDEKYPGTSYKPPTDPGGVEGYDVFTQDGPVETPDFVRMLNETSNALDNALGRGTGRPLEFEENFDSHGGQGGGNNISRLNNIGEFLDRVLGADPENRNADWKGHEYGDGEPRALEPGIKSIRDLNVPTVSRNAYETQRGATQSGTTAPLSTKAVETSPESIPSSELTTEPRPREYGSIDDIGTDDSDQTEGTNKAEKNANSFNWYDSLRRIVAGTRSGKGLTKLEALLAGAQGHGDVVSKEAEAEAQRIKDELAQRLLNRREGRADRQLDQDILESNRDFLLDSYRYDTESNLDERKFQHKKRMDAITALKVDQEIENLKKSGVSGGDAMKFANLVQRMVQAELDNTVTTSADQIEEIWARNRVKALELIGNEQ